VQQEFTSLLNTAGFTLRKWASNIPTFLNSITTELKETNQTLSLANDNGVTTLRLLWIPKTDQLQVRNKATTYKRYKKYKKDVGYKSLHF